MVTVPCVTGFSVRRCIGAGDRRQTLPPAGARHVRQAGAALGPQLRHDADADHDARLLHRLRLCHHHDAAKGARPAAAPARPVPVPAHRRALSQRTRPAVSRRPSAPRRVLP